MGGRKRPPDLRKKIGEEKPCSFRAKGKGMLLRRRESLFILAEENSQDVRTHGLSASSRKRYQRGTIQHSSKEKKGEASKRETRHIAKGSR